MTVNALSSQDLATLRASIDDGDRTKFYYDYWKMTGNSVPLFAAQVSSYSGIIGGAAIQGNYVAKILNQARVDRIKTDLCSSRSPHKTDPCRVQ